MSKLLRRISDDGTQMTRKMYSLFLGGIVMLMIPSLSWPYSFTPSEAEFRTWPAHCKVVYIRTEIGKRTTYARFVSQSDIVSGNAVLGNESPYGEGGLHHFCAGMKWLERAKVESDPGKRNFDLAQAKEETQYTLERTRPGGEPFLMAATQMASILYEQDEQSQALDLLDSVISQSPANPMLYVAKATIHYRRREYDLARDVLVEGDQHLNGTSPDIHYNLGLVLIKLGEPGLAAEHAYVAYDEGYPLPGLKRQLERLGYWKPPD